MSSVQVVPILGGIENPAIEAHAMYLIWRTATLTHGDAFPPCARTFESRGLPCYDCRC